ncbi:hypothetical protein Pcinc_044356 [Petrolisthes cinctipes]|uniref:Uncharacterized protein n=1 Tax=Petrolisthes cinctipes TaxID=88211 RepID=A0AAE1BE30_PETCI|nr:hypothetical protein Pcinc_044356 [Petrolisthes cinctipes]
MGTEHTASPCSAHHTSVYISFASRVGSRNDIRRENRECVVVVVVVVVSGGKGGVVSGGKGGVVSDGKGGVVSEREGRVIVSEREGRVMVSEREGAGGGEVEMLMEEEVVVLSSSLQRRITENFRTSPTQFLAYHDTSTSSAFYDASMYLFFHGYLWMITLQGLRFLSTLKERIVAAGKCVVVGSKLRVGGEKSRETRRMAGKKIRKRERSVGFWKR